MFVTNFNLKSTTNNMTVNVLTINNNITIHIDMVSFDLGLFDVHVNVSPPLYMVIVIDSYV